MSGYKARYGFTRAETNTLYACWLTKELKDGDWGSFDDFVRWCNATGWKHHCHLRKENQQKPHGPDNSFWEAPGGGSAGLYTPGNPCRSCGAEAECRRPCQARLDYWDEHMAAIRRRHGR